MSKSSRADAGSGPAHVAVVMVTGNGTVAFGSAVEPSGRIDLLSRYLDKGPSLQKVTVIITATFPYALTRSISKLYPMAKIKRG